MTNEIKQMVDELPTFTRMSEFREYVPKDKVIALVEELTKWNKVEDGPPTEDGQDILMQNDKWIDEDYNILGVRVGCYDHEAWISASWNRVLDRYETLTSEDDDFNTPSKWKYIY